MHKTLKKVYFIGDWIDESIKGGVHLRCQQVPAGVFRRHNMGRFV
jgi:hypothetical protein